MISFSKLNESIESRGQHTPTKRPRQTHSNDIPSCTTESSDSHSSPDSSTTMYRVQNKQLPCTKHHVLNTRDMEDVIMEEKPVSPTYHSTRQHGVHDHYVQVNVNSCCKRCTYACHTLYSNHFELSRDKERFRPVQVNQFNHHDYLQRSRRAFGYLPESAV